MLPGFVCFFVGLLYELEMGIFTGVGTHLVIVLYNSARPRVRVDIKQVRASSCSQFYQRNEKLSVFTANYRGS